MSAVTAPPGALRAGLDVARGEWVGFLEAGDTLAPHALAEVVLAAGPSVDVLYSDEDRLDGAGRRTEPSFKPDWSPDLLRSGNYIRHFLVARRTVLETVGGVREGFEGAEDYDLILRLSEATRGLGHVPKVLYHSRSDTLPTDGGCAPCASTWPAPARPPR
ncbi:hypothetical protein ACLESD_48695 [Pyxidicoccus sp. 3LFB2]